MRMPNHVGIIPDGNRRWANNKGMEKQCGYDFGLNPGLMLFRLCRAAGIDEITYYGFTTDNNKRPKIQRESFTKACVKAVEMLCNEDASLLVVGNTESAMFPKELIPYTKERKIFKKGGGVKVNFLVNYGWEWDLGGALENNKLSSRNKINKHIKSTDISRVDLIIRWGGGRRRLSGFLPIQSVYSDFYIIQDYWPDFKPEHFLRSLKMV